MMGRVTLRSEVVLNTRVDGRSDRPWLVLSNPLGATLSMWDPQMPLLTTRYRVLRYDTRGHGQSDTPPGPYSLDDLVQDVRELLLAFGIERASFMGLSLGGIVGLGLAIHHPERIDRVVCADGRADAPVEFRAMWDERIAAVESDGIEAIADEVVSAWVTADWRQANPVRVAEMREMVISTDADGFVSCCHGLKQLNYFGFLGQVRVPVFFVGGSEDKLASPEVMRSMAAATPGAEYRTVPGAAQISNVNAPGRFNSAIADFLRL